MLRRKATTFSTSLDTNDKFDTGLYLFIVSGSSELFFGKGVTVISGYKLKGNNQML